jgi:hypothetical protein
MRAMSDISALEAQLRQVVALLLPLTIESVWVESNFVEARQQFPSVQPTPHILLMVGDQVCCFHCYSPCSVVKLGSRSQPTPSFMGLFDALYSIASVRQLNALDFPRDATPAQMFREILLTGQGYLPFDDARHQYLWRWLQVANWAHFQSNVFQSASDLAAAITLNELYSHSLDMEFEIRHSSKGLPPTSHSACLYTPEKPDIHSNLTNLLHRPSLRGFVTFP